MRIVASILLAAIGLSSLTGCEVPPRFIEQSAEVDAFLARGAFASACVGLDMKDDELRTHTADRLVDYAAKKVANDCLCAALYDAEAHEADIAVLKGIEGSERDDLAECAAPALFDAQVENRVQVAMQIGAIAADKGYEALMKTMAEAEDPELRGAAASSIRHYGPAQATLLDAIANDPEPKVRAGAVKAMRGTNKKDAIAAISKALAEDKAPEVRAEAVLALAESKKAKQGDAICDALINDEDWTVREAAATAFHGSKRKIDIDCLEKRLRTKEEYSQVREATMKALKASPSEAAEDVLCNAIGPMMRMYVIDKVATEVPGVDIVTAQNDRDWERSFECVQQALRQGGYSCYAKNHLGYWMRQLGGNAPMPLCPGMKRMK